MAATVAPVLVMPPEAAPAKEQGPGRIRALDSMRGLAALMVMLFHVLWLSPLGGERADASLGLRIAGGLAARLFDGAAAVDFFFVLSGFVLALPHVGARPKALAVDDFVLRRVLRIMPTYWAGTAIALALRELTGSLPRLARMPVDWTTELTATNLLDLFVLVLGTPGHLINAPIWSLQVEMCMSLVLPFFIAAVMLKPGRVSSTLMLAIALLVPHFGAGDSGFGFLALFVLGTLLAYRANDASAWVRALPRAAVLALLVGALALFYNRPLQQVWVIPYLRPDYLSGAGSALLILLVISREHAPALLSNRPVLFLGDISYSLYVMHQPTLIATMMVVTALGGTPWLAVLVSIPVALLLSIALYRAVEAPSIRAGRAIVRRLLPRRVAPGARLV